MKIEANIISWGTESQSNSNGYMAITEIINKKRYILPIEHYVQNVDKIPNGSLIVKKEISLEQIAISRFMLITSLFLERYPIKKKSSILILGCGCVGYACIKELHRRGFSNIVLYEKNDKYKKFLHTKIINNLNEIKNYNYIIDTTGSDNILSKILNLINCFQTLILLGTPRKGPYIDLLQIHRKNLSILGAHELSGYSNKVRQKTFDKIIRYNFMNKEKFTDVCNKCDQKNKLRTSIYTIMNNF